MLKTQICAVAFLGAIAAPALAEEAIIINQEGSPLRIDNYTATYNSGVGRYSREGIEHKVQVSNTGQQAVVAYRISFVAFDAFNEEMGRALGGVAIETVSPGANNSGSWRQTPYASFRFQGYGTGVAYVSKARLADGTVWNADQSFVLSKLQEVQQDLTLDIFENVEE